MGCRDFGVNTSPWTLGFPVPQKPAQSSKPFLPCANSPRTQATALPPSKGKAEPVARAQQKLQQSRLRKGDGSILTWFSREVPSHGVSTVAIGKAEPMAAEQHRYGNACAWGLQQTPLCRERGFGGRRREGLWGQMQLEQPGGTTACRCLGGGS